MRNALLLLSIALPVLLGALFLPSEVVSMREELAWRNRTGPFAYLDQWPGGSYERLAMTEIDALQRPQGLVSRLVGSRYGDHYLDGADATRVRLSPDGREVLTGTATAARRWNADTGRSEVQYGWTQRRDAVDTDKWGYGFGEVAWLDGGRRVATMTSHAPQSIWFFGEGAPGPLALGGDGFSALEAQGHRVAYIRSFEHGAVFDLREAGPRGAAAIVRLPHPDISAIALAADGAVVTASRNEIRWWRDGRLERSVPIDGAYNPAGLSRGGAWVLIPADRRAEIWSTSDGRRHLLDHDSPVESMCGTATHLVTGTRDGRIHVWSIPGFEPVRSLRASAGSIDVLDCTQDRVLSVGDHRRDARVWDLQARPQAWSLPEPAPPRMGWLVMAGADLDLPGRFPGTVAMLEEWGPDLQVPAVGGIAIVLALALWLARARKAPD